MEGPLQRLHRNEMSNHYRGPFINVSYQVSVHLAQRFWQRIYFRYRPIRNKNCLWWPCLLTDQDKMCNLHRGPARCFLPCSGSFGQALRGEDFQKLANRKQELSVAAMFVNGSNQMSNLYRGPSIDASYQVLAHLAKRFQRRFSRNRPIRNKNCLQPPYL